MQTVTREPDRCSCYWRRGAIRRGSTRDFQNKRLQRKKDHQKIPANRGRHRVFVNSPIPQQPLFLQGFFVTQNTILHHQALQPLQIIIANVKKRVALFKGFGYLLLVATAGSENNMTRYKQNIGIGEYGKNRVTAGYEVEEGEGVTVVSLGHFESVEDALLALRKVPSNWTNRYYTLGSERFGESQ